MMIVAGVDIIGYAIGILSILLSILFYFQSQRRHRERLARLLDPHVVHQDLVRCRRRIARSSAGIYSILDPTKNTIEAFAIHHETIRAVLKYVLGVRSENFDNYDTLLEQAQDCFDNNRKEEGLKILDQVIILLAAEAKVLGE